MKKNYWIVLILIAVFLNTAETLSAQEEQKMRTLMFVGEPNAAAWQFMMDNPVDREKEVGEAFEKLGGRIIGYYFGLGDGKNYIICELPNDNELIQAVYIMRLPSGLLESYEIKELMPSEQMTGALKKAKELIKMEKAGGGGVE